MFNYFELLERAYKNLPKIETKSERFEFPEIIISYYKKRTIIENIKEISERFNRDIKIIQKFLQKEFGAPTELEKDKLVILKKIEEKKIKKKFEKFFEIFVKCPICNKPDTKIIKKGRIAYLKCGACGAESPIKYVF